MIFWSQNDPSSYQRYELPRPWENQQSALAKTKAQISFAVTAKLISAFVFATRIVQFLFYLNPKFQDASSHLCLYSSVYVEPVRKPHCWFSHEAARIFLVIIHGDCVHRQTLSRYECKQYIQMFGITY